MTDLKALANLAIRASEIACQDLRVNETDRCVCEHCMSADELRANRIRLVWAERLAALEEVAEAADKALKWDDGFAAWAKREKVLRAALARLAATEANGVERVPP